MVGSTQPRSVELVAIFEQDVVESIDTVADGMPDDTNGVYTISGYRIPKYAKGINIQHGKIIDIR